MSRHIFHNQVSILIIILVTGMSSLLRVSGQNYLPDNIVPANCTTDVEPMDWGVQIDWSSNTIVSNHNIPLVGDLDGDGHPEILCFSLSGQTGITNIGNIDNQMLVFDGVTKQLKATITMESPVSAYDAAAYGLVRTSNGKGLIVAACFDNKLRAYDISSATPNNPYWVSDFDFGSATGDFAVNVNFADFNMDGKPEVYVRNKVYNAENGKLLATAPTSNSGSSYCHYTHYTHRKLSSPFAADLNGDGWPELILGNEIFEVSINNTTGSSGNSISLSSQTAPPASVPTDGNPQVADFNMDGHPDVFISVRNTDGHAGTVYCYVWDVFHNSVSAPLAISNYRSGKSIPLIADIDNDHNLEIVIQSGTSNSNKIQAYKYNAASGSFSPMWGMVPDEDSYSNSFTAFDFNLDGILELIICDQSTIKIVNGSGKSHLTGHDTVPVYMLASFPFTETTIMQYPVIADVDADGSAEIVSVGSTKLNVFKSSGQPWAPARPVWNQYMYNVTNINKDLTVPAPLFNNATPFTDPQGIVRRPFNNFLQQATTLDQYGRPFSALANATVIIDDIVHNDTLFTLTYQLCNTGSLTLFPPIPCSFYADNYRGVYLGELAYNNPLDPGDCVLQTMTFTEQFLRTHCDYNNLDSIILVVNENQNGIAQNGGLQTECDTNDNILGYYVDRCHIPRDTITIDVCIRGTYSDSNFDITPTETSIAGTYYLSRVFHIGSCDSIIVLRLQVHPDYDRHLSETIHDGTDYDLHGLFFPADLLAGLGHLDTSVTFQTVFGCDSTLHLSIVIAVPELTIHLPNAITPNGDGLNDYFSIPDLIQSQMADFEIYIYNRWGEPVFYSKDKAFKWNGEFKGEILHGVVYAYIIRYKDTIGEKHILKGVMTVL